MKFGVLQFFSWPQRRVPLSTVYERALQRIAIMDTTGYDAVWLAEHHFTHYSVCPSVHLMGMHVASQTRHLRIGTGISLAAFYHPLRLAEEVALLDVLSGGRVNWGAGRGFDPTEFKAFGVPPQESHARFREAVEIVLAAWQNERLTWDGDYWHFEDIEVLPKPLQQPHPHTWIAAGSLDSVCWAAAQGYSIMLGGTTHALHRAGPATRDLTEGNGGTRPHHYGTRYSHGTLARCGGDRAGCRGHRAPGRQMADGIVHQSRQSCQCCSHGNLTA